MKNSKLIFQVVFGLVATVVIINLSSCASQQQNPNLPSLMSASDYYSTVDKYTDTKKIYDGFNQVLQISGTLLNSKVSRGQVDQRARFYQWNQDQYSVGKTEVENSLSRETKIFVSLWVPERKQDDLQKTATTWKIFLDAGGKRYEGKAQKIKAILADTQGFYPHHTRFSTPYLVTFSVPVSKIENTESRFTITGPVTSVALDYKPVE